jgi:hypothetical protein
MRLDGQGECKVATFQSRRPRMLLPGSPLSVHDQNGLKDETRFTTGGRFRATNRLLTGADLSP